MRSASALIMVLVILIGCASTETVRESRTEAKSKNFGATFGSVFSATLRAAESQKLDVVTVDRKAGRIDLSHGVTLWSTR